MLSRVSALRGRSKNLPAAFIIPCRPLVSARPPRGPGWAHELKHDGYRLQIHVRDGRVRLYTMNSGDWTARYPLIVEQARRFNGTTAILDAEVVCAGKDGVPDFDALHSRTQDHVAVACAFDLLMFNGDDLRHKPFTERKAGLRKLLSRSRDGIQHVDHTEGDGEEMFQVACKLGLEGIVSKRIDAPYRSGRARSWLKIKNPNAPAATRAQDGTF